MTFYQCVKCEQVFQDDELEVEPARPAIQWVTKDGNALRRYACPSCHHHFFEITLVV